MAIIKITSSKKGFMVVDDDGNVFMTSIASVRAFLNKESVSGFITLTRMPFKASDDRFPKSPEFKKYHNLEVESTKASNDVFSKKYKKDTQQKKAYEDVEVW
jgi:hypothetical protein